MEALILPVSGYTGIASWQTHINRGTPSQEPGTDLYIPIGTPIYAPASGTIWGYGTSIGPATGRWVGINFDMGMSFRCLHNSRLVKTFGRVEQGELIAYSGASGYGEEDWSWNVAETGGAHTHITLWPTWDHLYGYRSYKQPYTIDPMLYMNGATAGTDSKPFIPEGFLMALSDNEQKELYGWVKGLAFGDFPKGGDQPIKWWLPALGNAIDAGSKATEDVRNSLRARNDEGTEYLGYDMLPAIMNQNVSIEKKVSSLDLTFSKDDLDYLAAEVAKDVLAGLPASSGGKAPSAEEIAAAVRAKFASEPLK